MKMSAPAPDCTAAVIRGWRSLKPIVSSVTSAPRALEASGMPSFLSHASASGMKSFHRTMCSLVPWAKAGARRAARIPSIPVAAGGPPPAAHRQPPEGEGSEEEPPVRAQRVVDGAARIGAQPHPHGGDEEHRPVGRAHDALAEVLPRDKGVEWHGAAIAHSEDEREPVHGAEGGG